MSDIKNKLNQLYDLENCGLAILDSQHYILDCNNSFKKLFGYLNNELINQSIELIFKDIDAWKARIQSIKDANPKE